jgi:hypothetical protein
MFASKSLGEHLLRGLIGVGALVAAAAYGGLGWPLLVLLPMALVALRGCPACWTIGLVQTVWAKVRRRPAAGACLDGACARP